MFADARQDCDCRYEENNRTRSLEARPTALVIFQFVDQLFFCTHLVAGARHVITIGPSPARLRFPLMFGEGLVARNNGVLLSRYEHPC